MLHFNDISEETPTVDSINAEYNALWNRLDSTSDKEDALTLFNDWDNLRRRLSSWHSLVHLRFSRDTTRPEHKSDVEYLNELKPEITRLEVEMKRRWMDSPHRSMLAQHHGSHLFALWEKDLASFDPSIQGLMVRESKLTMEYVELLAQAKIDFDGKTQNLSSMAGYSFSPDRTKRYQASHAVWSWFETESEQLDQLYDQLVKTRTEMAGNMGYENFVPLGYERMQRVDYVAEDVARFREGVLEHVVPVVSKLKERQAKTLGVEEIMSWDSKVYSKTPPKPEGDLEWIEKQTQKAFTALDDSLGGFYHKMYTGSFMDLAVREGKSGGGFCTGFPTYGMPYIFANFNGTQDDIRVLIHELGHAFQCYKSRNAEVIDYLWPTYESCEIHSMGLEFLVWPELDHYFGESADLFRTVHLIKSLDFLPYGVAVDHFQHLIYEAPEATPQERHNMWKETEKTYMPWTNYGDLTYPGKGARWQSQRHIYGMPFYYIDYTLALTCALQLWVQSRADFQDTMRRYVSLCTRGGNGAFRTLVQSAGLISPFEQNCLKNVVQEASEFLGL